MEMLNDTVSWYQAKIGAYDKQLWEKSVEQAVLKNIKNLPKKKATVKPELIDVDLVRGSTFSKAKSTHGWVSVAGSGLQRVIFLPLYLTWWQRQTSKWLGGLLLVLYMLQVITMVTYYTDTGDNVNAERLSLAHLVSPVLLFLTLAVLHAQIVATHECLRQRRERATPVRKVPKRKKKKTHHSTYAYANPRCDSGCLDVGGLPLDVTASAPSANPSTAGEKVRENSQCKCDGYISGDEDGMAASEDSKFVIKPELLKVVLKDEGSAMNAVKKNDEEVFESDLVVPPKPVTNPDIVIENLRTQNCDKTDIVDEGKNEIETETETETLLYTPRDDTEAVTGNTQETGEDLNHPIEEFTGSLLLPEQNQANLAGGVDLLCATVDDSKVFKGMSSEENVSDVDYIPADKQADEGNIDLIGIKHRQGGSQVRRRRHKVTSKFDFAEGSKVDDDLDGIARPAVDGFLPEIAIGQEGGARGFTEAVIGRDSLTGEEPNCFGGARPKYPKYTTTDKEYLANVSRRVRKRSTHRFDAEEPKPELTNQKARHISGGKTDLEAIIRTTGSSCDSEAETTSLPPSPKAEVAAAESGAAAVTTSKLSMLYVHPLNRHRGNHGDRDADSATVTSLLHQGGQTSELEWELNNADTTSDMTTDSTDNELSEDEEDEGMDGDSEEEGGEAGGGLGHHDSEEGWNQSVQNVTSVMNNLASNTDKVSCMIWEGEEVKKADLTVLDIGWSIIQKVDKLPQSNDYLLFGVGLSVLIMLMPALFRAYHSKFSDLDITDLQGWRDFVEAVFGSNWREVLVVVNGIIQRLFLCLVFFFLLSVAERTFKQRLLYAKHFCYLTSSRRAKKYELPHFRLNKVRSIKTWLSLRSYLKKRGPQRSVDSIVSAAFFIAISFVSLMCIELLHDTGTFLDHMGNWELVVYCMGLGVYLLRFMTLGTKINKKYRNFSVLITEQINLYLRMEQKPDKKDELMLAHNVLKLAEALLKELESPFKVSGLSANPFLYNVTKVVILSAFSAVLTELLGFKLKLYKIKIKA